MTKNRIGLMLTDAAAVGSVAFAAVYGGLPPSGIIACALVAVLTIAGAGLLFTEQTT